MEKKIGCIGCDLKKGKIKTRGEKVIDGKYFEVRQDYEIPIPGFLVIASKRHIIGFADFNNEEKQEFIDILCNLCKLIKKVLEVKYISYLCREDIIEDKKNPSHFHIGLLPKYLWMKKFQSIGEILDYARKKMNTKENIQQVDNVIKKIKENLNTK